MTLKPVMLSLALSGCATTHAATTTPQRDDTANHHTTRYTASITLENKEEGLKRDETLVLSLVEVPLSSYEIEKDPQLKGKTFLAAVLSSYAKERRGVKADCKLPEEMHYTLTGNADNKGLYRLHGDLQDNGMPIQTIFLYLKPEGDRLTGSFDYSWHTAKRGPKGERIPVTFTKVRG
jgi:hypothetical protein